MEGKVINNLNRNNYLSFDSTDFSKKQWKKIKKMILTEDAVEEQVCQIVISYSMYQYVTTEQETYKPKKKKGVSK